GQSGTIVFSNAALSNGASNSLSIVLRVNANALAGSSISNSVTVASGTLDPDATNDSATAISTVQRQSNLAIAISDSPDPAMPTQTLTYTIITTNLGPSDADSAAIFSAFPISANGLAGINFTAALAGGAIGASNGSGNINQTVNMPVNSTITYS